jgi:hypothetical protein
MLTKTSINLKARPSFSEAGGIIVAPMSENFRFQIGDDAAIISPLRPHHLTNLSLDA